MSGCGYVIDDFQNCLQCGLQLEGEHALRYTEDASISYENKLNEQRKKFFLTAIRVASVSGEVDGSFCQFLRLRLNKAGDDENVDSWASQSILYFTDMANTFREQADQQQFAIDHVTSLVKRTLQRGILCDISPEMISLIILGN